MRNCVIAGAATLVVMGIVMGCGAFGSADQPAADPTPPPEDAAVSAVPPVTGDPLVGVFVSSSKGNDKTSRGTATSPWKTLAAAMQDAKSKSVHVIACAEDYPEAVVVLDGVSVFGGYDCSTDDWQKSATRSTVHSPTSPALLAKSIALDTRIDGFEFYSPDFGGEPPSETPASSVGIEIHSALTLVISSSLVHAGSGGPGKDGVEGPTNTETSARTFGIDAVPQGGSTACPFGASCLHVAGQPWLSLTSAGGTSACAMGASGGAGGTGGNAAMFTTDSPCSPEIAANDAHGKPLTATGATAAGSVDYCTDYRSGIFKVGYGVGTGGANGPDGPDGANGMWALTAAGFVSGNGKAGADGVAGQGGGGGGGTIDDTNATCANICPSPSTFSTYNWSSRGAGGGAGGCAGFAGTPGFGGGASIAAFVDTSTIELADVTLVSTGGGAGGRGTLGSNGLPGGSGGAAAGQGGAGGLGGHGGYGGLSGNGAPGPSIALAYTGTRPITSQGTVLQPGNGGAQLPALTKTANQGTKSLPAIAGESIMERVF